MSTIAMNYYIYLYIILSQWIRLEKKKLLLKCARLCDVLSCAIAWVLRVNIYNTYK